MLDFTGVKAITIPEGNVKKITRKMDGALLWEKVTSRLPSAYQEVEYIAGNKNCAIVSDILYDNYKETGIIVSAKVSADEGGDNYFCSMYSPTKSWFHIQNGYYASTQRNGWLASTVAANIGEIIEIEGRVSFDYNGYLKVNGETILSGLRNYSDLYFENAYLFICGYNYEGRLINSYGWRGKCYWCVIKDTSGNVIGDFVPCYRKSDGEIGLYNIVTNTFCTKTGTGSFTKGANV
jgi:hypothetical protein